MRSERAEGGFMDTDRKDKTGNLEGCIERVREKKGMEESCWLTGVGKIQFKFIQSGVIK